MYKRQLLYGCETWTLLADLEERLEAFETKCMRKLLRISYLEHKTSNWVRSNINFLVGRQELILVNVKRRKLAWLGCVTRMTASPKPSFRAPSRPGDAVAGRGNAGWITSKSGHPCPCQNCSHWPPAENTGREPLLNSPSCSPDDLSVRVLK